MRWIFLFLAAASAIVAATAATTSNHGHDDDDGHHHEQQQQERQLKLKNNVVRPFLQKWRTARSDCTIQVISYMQIPTEPPLAEGDEEFVCELDPADAPGGYSGMTRTLGLTAKQKAVFKNMWAQDKLLPGESKLMISQISSSSSTSSSLGVGGGVQVTAGGGFKFNSQMIQIPPEINIMEAVNWGDGRFEVVEQDTAVMDSQPTNNITSTFTTTSLSNDLTLSSM